jgi:RNA-dependent RNA polymerase
VDYPKNGNPVLPDKKEMPRLMMQEKPDWHSAEDAAPNEVDYYESDRALGYLFRAIQLVIPKEPEASTLNDTTNPSHSLTDAVSLALAPMVGFWVGQELDEESTDDETKDLFSKYVNEFSYICSTHTVSTRPDAGLQEAEIVVGSILDKCRNKRYRTERAYAMGNHTSVLVGDIERAFVDKSKQPGLEEWRKGLERAWKAWDFSQRHGKLPGTSSFGLIALGTVLDCLDKLGG